METSKEIKLPSPYMLMKHAQRDLKFDSKGKPLHPLNDIGVNLTFLKKKNLHGLDRWGTNHMCELLITSQDHILLRYDPQTKEWRFPGMFGKVDASKVLLSVFGKKSCGSNVGNTLYKNFNNFDKRTTLHSWIETSIFHVKLHDLEVCQNQKANVKWFHISQLPSKLHSLHHIILSKNTKTKCV